VQSINQEYRGTFWGGAVPISDLLKSGSAGARRIRGGATWRGVSKLLGVEATTVVIGCLDEGYDAFKALLASNMSRSVRQIIVCVSIIMCRVVPGSGGCTRWYEPSGHFSGKSDVVRWCFSGVTSILSQVVVYVFIFTVVFVCCSPSQKPLWLETFTIIYFSAARQRPALPYIRTLSSYGPPPGGG
jgi:hypothetical protein